MAIEVMQMPAVAYKTLDEGRAAILRDRSRQVILARITEAERQKELEVAVCQAVRSGESAGEISAATGLNISDIELMVARGERTYTLDLELDLG